MSTDELKPTDAQIEAGIGAWQGMLNAMEAREQSDHPEDMPDYDEGDLVAAIYSAMRATRPPASAAPGDELVERLRRQSESASKIARQMAEDKSLRQGDNPEQRTDLYFWPTPEQTIEGRAADQLTVYARRVAEVGWQPIEAAPKDGSRLDLWVTYWTSDKASRSERYPFSKWYSGGWIDRYGNRLEWEHEPDEEGFSEGRKVTHFMVVEPPRAALTGEQG